MLTFALRLVPFNQANSETKVAFLAGLKRWRQLDGNPDHWLCAICGTLARGFEIYLSYGQGVDTPQPVCVNDKCGGIGIYLRPLSDPAASAG